MKALIRLFLAGLIVVVGAAIAESIPQDVLAGLQARAAETHPGNHAEQQRYIREQSDAYRTIEAYSNPKVPAQVIDRIRVNVAVNHPFDFTRQLYFLNQQTNLFLRFGLVSSHVLPPRVVDCEELEWRLAVRGQPATYRGTVKPGTADIIYIEVRKGQRLVGQNFAFPNPGGAWEVMVWGDHLIKRSHREIFYCEKY